jgi:hypothetical protein
LILASLEIREICVFQLQTLKEHEMKRIALVTALLALALTACGQKAAEAPAVAVVVTPAAPAPVAAPDAASAPVAAPAPAPAAADAMKK